MLLFFFFCDLGIISRKNITWFMGFLPSSGVWKKKCFGIYVGLVLFPVESTGSHHSWFPREKILSVSGYLVIICIAVLVIQNSFPYRTKQSICPHLLLIMKTFRFRKVMFYGNGIFFRKHQTIARVQKPHNPKCYIRPSLLPSCRR